MSRLFNFKVLRAVLAVLSSLTFAVVSSAEENAVKEPFIRAYDDLYFITGIPLNEPVTLENADIKYKIGLRTRDLCSPGGWDLYIAYRQTAIWDAYAVSGPFRDILFQPGVYFNKVTGNHSLTAGIEHLSNGRPYFGNKPAAPGYDDLSRGMNYLLFKWEYTEGSNEFSILAKAGAGCGVGSYERHFTLFTQDLFVYYLGYLTFDYRHTWEKFDVHASITPIWNKSIANVTLDSSWNFHPRWPGVFLEFNYGYHEALCICSPDSNPLCNIRTGLRYSFR